MGGGARASHLSNHRTLLAFVQDFNLMMPVLHLQKFSVLNPLKKILYKMEIFLPRF